MKPKFLICLAIALCSCGCATAPEALTQANHGLALSTGLKQALATFAMQQSAIEDMRKQQIEQETRNQNLRLLDVPVNEQTYEFSGQARRLTAIRQLRSRAALLTARAAASEAAEANISERTGQLATPLPPIGDTIDATGKAFGELGTELSERERRSLAYAFFKDVAEEAEKNRKAAQALGNPAVPKSANPGQ